MTHRKGETDFVKRALALLHARYPGSEWWRQNSGKVKVKGGWMQLAPEHSPDIIGRQRFGMMAFCEVKRKGKKLTEGQWAFLSRQMAAGCLTLVYVEDTLFHLRDLPERHRPTAIARGAA